MRKKSSKPKKGVQTFNNVKWLYKKFYSISKKDTILLTTLPIIVALLPILTSYLWARVIDALVALLEINIDSLSSLMSETNIVTLVILLILGGSITNLIHQLISYIRAKYYGKYLQILRMQLAQKLSEMDVASTENPKIYELAQKSRDNFYKIRGFFNSISSIITAIVQIVAKNRFRPNVL